MATEAACTPQTPGLVLRTSTPDCTLSAELYVDTMYGTLVALSPAFAASCTVEP